MDFWLCFWCPGKFCELLSEDSECNTNFVEDLINQALGNLLGIVLVDRVDLNFSASENMYFVQIHIRRYIRHYEFLSDLAAGRLEVECLVSQALLQCFWEVHYAEC